MYVRTISRVKCSNQQTSLLDPRAQVSIISIPDPKDPKDPKDPRSTVQKFVGGVTFAHN
jgi:hypothetical protein